MLIGAIAAAMIVALAGCQHAPKSRVDTPNVAWRVMERVGDVRSAMETGPASSPLRPGDIITQDRLVATGAGALVILAGDGVQLTAGENTTLRLSTSSAANLLLERGWLRARLTTAVNGQARIETQHFDINASNATLTLRASQIGTDVTIETGSAALSTTDGRHQATLSAGAAAKIGRASGDDLLIRPASGSAFTRVAPLPPPKPVKNDGQDQAGPKDAGPPSAAQEPLAVDYVAAEVPTAVDDLTILPASRLKAIDDDQVAVQKPVETAELLQERPASRPALTNPEDSAQAVEGFSVDGNLAPTPILIDPVVTRPDGSVQMNAKSLDPLQLKFDRLTKGLVDAL